MSSLNEQESELKDHLGVRFTPYWEIIENPGMNGVSLFGLDRSSNAKV